MLPFLIPLVQSYLNDSEALTILRPTCKNISSKTYIFKSWIGCFDEKQHNIVIQRAKNIIITSLIMPITLSLNESHYITKLIVGCSNNNNIDQSYQNLSVLNFPNQLKVLKIHYMKYMKTLLLNLPKDLTHLEIININSNYVKPSDTKIVINSWPSGLQTLICNCEMSDFVQLPSSLKILHMLCNTEEILKENFFNEGLEYIKFPMHMQMKHINNCIMPNSMKTIEMGVYLRSNMFPNVPNTIRRQVPTVFKTKIEDGDDTRWLKTINRKRRFQ
jgi:hypothetical protein